MLSTAMWLHRTWDTDILRSLFFDPLAVGILKIDLVDTVGTKDNFAECAAET